jgi:ankyrin repeat protein
MEKPARTLLVILFFSLSTAGQNLGAKLVEAAKTPNTPQVEKLLAAGADPNTKDDYGWTALMWASSFGRTRNVLALLKKGADVNAKDNNGWTALMSAARGGHTDTARVLLEKGGAVNAQDKVGWTALLAATDSGHRDTVLALLNKGADANARDRDGSTALSIAKEHKYSEIVALLERKTGVVPGQTPGKPGSLSAAKSPAATTSKVPAPSHSTTSALTDREGLVKRLLEAAQVGDTSDVQSLLAQGVDPNGRGADGNTALMGAAVTGHTDIVRVLLERGANVNAQGNSGRTALMDAAVEGYADTMRVLLEKGADANAKDAEGWTALFWAAFSRRTQAVRVLLEKGADVNATNKYDDTALIRSAYGGDTDTVIVLMENHANLNAKDNIGRTALIEAARQGHADTVGVLLEKGADATVKDRDGNTALSMAKNKYPKVVALLENTFGTSQTHAPERTGDSAPEGSSTAASNSVQATTTGVQPLQGKIHPETYFRLGLNMQMIDVWWSQTNDLAAGWASGIQADLRKIDAPGDLIELASRAETQLKGPLKQDNHAVAEVVKQLGTRLEKLSASHAEGKVFYSAGRFAYRVTLFGEDVQRPGEANASIENSRHELLPLANTLVAQCSELSDCKERALLFFADIATLLKKARLAPNDGSQISKDCNEIEMALGGEEH